MIIDQKLNSQFLLFEDDENSEIPPQEPGENSFEDTDNEEEEEEDKEDDDLEKME